MLIIHYNQEAKNSSVSDKDALPYALNNLEIYKEFYEKHKEEYRCEFSSEIVLNAFRVLIKRMPIEERPNIKWFINNREVHFDNNLKSHDAWRDNYIDYHYDLLLELL